METTNKIHFTVGGPRCKHTWSSVRARPSAAATSPPAVSYRLPYLSARPPGTVTAPCPTPATRLSDRHERTSRFNIARARPVWSGMTYVRVPARQFSRTSQYISAQHVSIIQWSNTVRNVADIQNMTCFRTRISYLYPFLEYPMFRKKTTFCVTPICILLTRLWSLTFVRISQRWIYLPNLGKVSGVIK